MTTILANAPKANRPTGERHVHETIQCRLASCSYAFVFSKVSWDFEDGRLTLRGCVPSFYLKQVLQELLRDIEHVQHIVNDVDVINTNGLSSVRPK